MNDSVQECMTQLKELARATGANPEAAAANIVREFVGGASKGDRAQLKAALEDARIVALNSEVPPAFLSEHQRWLAVVRSAGTVA